MQETLEKSGTNYYTDKIGSTVQLAVNDKFAEKLRAEYPEMKRIFTPDTYKDRNDTLCGISKNN